MHSRRCPADTDRGAAVVDFVLVSVILVPLVLGIAQVALVMHVRNTLAAAAAEGARYAATIDRGPAAGIDRTRSQIDAAIGSRFAQGVEATEETDHGVPMVVVTVHARVPPLGLWGPAVSFDVQGHAVEEQVVTAR